MNLKATIHKSLQDNLSYPQEVMVEDVINWTCGYRHYMQLSGEEPDRQESPERIILREIGRDVIQLVGKYFAGTYPETYRGGYRVMEGAVAVDIAGFVEDTLLDVAVVSTTTYSDDRPPRRALLAAATRAAIVGAKRVILTVIDRDKQLWTFWELTGDFEKVSMVTRDDINYITALDEGTGRPIGVTSKGDCKSCPWASKCTLHPTDDAKTLYDASPIRVVKSLRLRTEIHKHLWSLNDVPNGRIKKVIHPSEISTTACDRLIAYGLRGDEEKERVDPKLRRIFDFGHLYHAIFQAAMSWAIEGFEEEVHAHHVKLRIEGHSDGTYGKRCLEIKSMSSTGFAKLTSPKSDHKKQATTYAVIQGKSIIDYVYINKETAELAVYSVPPDKGTWHKTALRAGDIIKTVESGKLPPQIDSDYACSRCKFAWTCKPDLLLGAGDAGRGARSFKR